MTSLVQTGYQKLVRDIGEIYRGASQALVKAYWEIGRRLVESEQNGALRARYGDGLVEAVSEDLSKAYGSGFSLSNLKRMRKFYLLHRKGAPAHQLSWAHHVELLSVGDPEKRRGLEKRALREGLKRNAVRAMVQAAISKEAGRSDGKSGSSSSPASSSIPRLLTPIRGRLYTHQIVEKGGALYLDLGFRNYRRLTPAQAAHFKKGDIVEMLPQEKLRTLTGASARDLYTYEAELDRVYDADTQWYFIFTSRSGDAPSMRNDKLRLRGIDCRELGTASGRKAKEFVRELFGRAMKLTVTTTKPDKFDRYLSDIFLGLEDGTELFLNNELLKQGYARRYEDPKPEDWDD